MAKDQSPGEALVASGAMVMKTENDEMHSIAVAHPRDEVALCKALLAELETHPELAGEAFYSIPYKTHTRSGKCTGRSDDPCPVDKYVEDIGIGGAQNFARRWGNCTSRVEITGEDDDAVRLTGIFLDLETMTRTERPFSVTKWQGRRSGGPEHISGERLQMAIQAGVSKCARNVILAGMPAWLKKEYFAEAKSIVARHSKADLPSLLTSFAKLKEPVTEPDLERYYGGKLEELEPQQLASIRGLYVSLRDGIVTKAFIFEGGGSEPAARETETADDLMKGETAAVVAGIQTREAEAEAANHQSLVHKVNLPDAPEPKPRREPEQTELVTEARQPALTRDDDENSGGWGKW